MAVRPVLRIPNAVLSSPTMPVERIDDVASDLARDLLDTMAASPACVGLAANQIGVGLRAFAVDVTGHKKANSCHGAFVLFNPEVISESDMELAREGCMSVPDLTGDVHRATKLIVAGIGPDGSRRQLEVDQFEARAVLHEIDHLDGFVFVDKVAGPQAIYARRVYKALRTPR